VTEESAFTIESFYEFVKQGRIMGAKCQKCGTLLVPPKPMCPKCFSKDMKWKELQKQGKLLTYTVIHVSTKKFQALTPYAVGIIELERGAQLPGMIKEIALDKIKIDMNLIVDFEKEQISDGWPQWPRYYFKPHEATS
jgi:uncharacterized OB-fold protein